jgi:hypothetical protein
MKFKNVYTMRNRLYFEMSDGVTSQEDPFGKNETISLRQRVNPYRRRRVRIKSRH